MNYVVDDIGTVVGRMRDSTLAVDDLDYGKPFYMFGHRQEINRRLLTKNNNPNLKNKKYPLIILRLDLDEELEGGMFHYNLNIAIVTLTNKNLNAEERYTEVFKPILYPLYESFLKEIKASGLFVWPGNQLIPPHVKIDRPYWGIEDLEANTKNIFSDPLDAIEIVNLKLNQYKKC